MYLDEAVVILRGLIHLDQRKFVIAGADGRRTWRSSECRTGCRCNKERQIFRLNKFHFSFLINLFVNEIDPCLPLEHGMIFT